MERVEVGHTCMLIRMEDSFSFHTSHTTKKGVKFLIHLISFKLQKRSFIEGNTFHHFILGVASLSLTEY